MKIPLQAIICIFAVLTLLNLFWMISGRKIRISGYLKFIWFFFLIFLVGEFVSFYAAAWLWGFLSFFSLREFFSLIDFRMQDRFGIIAAYLSIPFMMHFVHIDWYNMFIITIPVYSFLVIPFLVALGGKEKEGAISSIGIISFGLFLFVYCIGHIAYLTYYSLWTACMLILNLLICDTSTCYIEKSSLSSLKRLILLYFIPVPFTILLSYFVRSWCGLPVIHSIILGLIIPLLVIIGRFTIRYLESDLGIIRENLKPGRGLLLDNIMSLLYSAPVVLHYYRYFII
ncbi:hypothetical protein ACFL4T_14650 [candidate division KSB1 bacterium]